MPTAAMSNRPELLKYFRQLGLPQTHNTSTWLSFNKLTNVLVKPETTLVVQNLISTACGIEVARKDARMFLSAYMILTCPDAIFQETPQEENSQLRDTARNMLIAFEEWLAAENPTTDLDAQFAARYRNYIAIFETWKLRDKKRLEAVIMAYRKEVAMLQNVFATSDSQVHSGIKMCIQEADRRLETLRRM